MVKKSFEKADTNLYFLYRRNEFLNPELLRLLYNSLQLNIFTLKISIK